MINVTVNHRFVVVSNMRSGSTWLETMLGALPDVFTDFEFKWRPTYEPSLIHIVLNEKSPPLVRCLDVLADQRRRARMKPLRVVGSKLVFDPKQLPETERAQLRSLFSRDIAVVHLSRPYEQVLMSRLKGASHLLNPEGPSIRGQALARTLQETTTQFQQSALHAQALDPVAVYNELCIYLENDLWAQTLRDVCPLYMRIDYGQIQESFYQIARHVGSQATADQCEETLRRPPTLKLPVALDHESLTNRHVLEPLFVAFETLRQTLLPVDGAPRS